MKNKLLFCVLLFSVFCFVNCNSKKHDSNRQIINDLQYDVSILHKEYNKSKLKVSIKLKVSLLNQNISPLRKNINSYEDYDFRVRYSMDKIKGDFILKTLDKDLFPKFIHFENNHGLTNFETYILVFENDHIENVESLVLQYNDVLFNNGIIKFNLVQ